MLSPYELRCGSCMVKPVDFEPFANALPGIADHGFTRGALPTDPQL